MKPVEIVFEGIRNRLAFLPIQDGRLQQITADPNRIWFTSRGNISSLTRDEATEKIP